MALPPTYKRLFISRSHIKPGTGSFVQSKRRDLFFRHNYIIILIINYLLECFPYKGNHTIFYAIRSKWIVSWRFFVQAINHKHCFCMSRVETYCTIPCPSYGWDPRRSRGRDGTASSSIAASADTHNNALKYSIGRGNSFFKFDWPTFAKSPLMCFKRESKLLTSIE